MVKNVGSTEKVIRIIIGLALLSMLFWVEGQARWWGLIGLVPIATALVSWCPVWALFGINTAGK
jgi:hypothetical protein